MNEVDIHTGNTPPRITGRLSNTKGKHIFSYRHDAEEALSVTMPLRHESYQHGYLHPIFQMNLPEGALRSAIERMTAKQYGSDDLTMLTILGCHQIGRISYSQPEHAPVSHSGDELSLKKILAHKDSNLFGALLQRYAQTSGVAGVQPKVLLDIKTRLTLPAERYIVKSWGDDYPHLACNEFICMSIARDAGLQVPDFYLSENAKLLITRRFDIDEQGQALGFEDFCVLQGKGTREKYDSSLEACTHTIRQFVSPEYVAQALYDFYKLTVLNIRMRNGDAHLKNSGILYSNLADYKQGELPNTTRRLAPIFDLVSTTPYLPNDTMALTITGSKRWPKQKALEAFGKGHCQLSREQVMQASDEVTQGIQANLTLLEALQNKHDGFVDTAEKMLALLT